MPIEHISDTARWVATYRAMETERPDAIFRDPHARRLAGSSGEEIVATMKRGRDTAWALIVRTAVFDELILDRITTGGIDLVVNLAAGLDARPWRMPLPPSLRWVDVDLPAILEYKTTVLKDEVPRCRYEAVAADLTSAEVRTSLLRRLGDGSQRALVVTEGLLIYLTAEQVRALADDLHAVPAYRWWLTDLASPQLLQWMSRDWGKAVAAGNAPFQFGPAEGTRWFEPSGWRELVWRSTWTEGQRLHRQMKLAWLWNLLGRLQPAARRQAQLRISGYALLERTD